MTTGGEGAGQTVGVAGSDGGDAEITRSAIGGAVADGLAAGNGADEKNFGFPGENGLKLGSGARESGVAVEAQAWAGVGGGEGEAGDERRGVAPVVGKIFWKQIGALELSAGESGIRIGAGEVGKGSDQVEEGLLGDELQEVKEFGRRCTEAIHARIEFGLDESGGAGALGGAGEFAGFGQRGEGDREAVTEGDGKFKWKSGAEKEDGLTDAGLAQLNTFGCAGDAKLLASRSGEGAGDGNKTVSIGIVFDHGEQAAFFRQSATEDTEIVAKSGER